MNLGLPPNKHFDQDIKVFEEKLRNKEPFSFSKFADGEWAVMMDKDLNNREFWFKEGKEFSDARDRLIESFQYKNPHYHVGISCPCCQGELTHLEMKVFSGQPDERLTWANLWVNSNYQYYLDNIVPLFNDYNVALVAHENSVVSRLPFEPKIFCTVTNNAWIASHHKLERMIKIIDEDQMEGWLFLFCCGPFGNILCHRFTEHNDKNTYLDIGSTLNPFLKTEGFKRGYFSKHKSMTPCMWG